jgi:predicted phosphodiesterase
MIYLLGDVHGNFDHILLAIQTDRPQDGTPKTVIFLGDVQAQRPFEEEIRPLIDAGIEAWFIHGNHDTDSPEEWRHLKSSWHRNLHGRIVEMDGLRVAGLGGTFREKIWVPPAPPQFHAYQYFEEELRRRSMPSSARDPVLLRYSAAVFPDAYEALSQRRADILVTHEAPSCHPRGFPVIDELARTMGVQALFHGHHHDSLDYRPWDVQLGFKAYGVGFCGITDIFGRQVLAGDFDEALRYREAHPVTTSLPESDTDRS